jgi:hypothetical protein
MICGWRGVACVVSKGGWKGGETIVVVYGWMSRGGRVGVVVRVIVGVREWGELCGERELLGLLGLLMWLLVRGLLGSGDVKDVVAILLWVLWVTMGRSFGGIGRLGWALLRLVVMRMMLVLGRLWWGGHETGEFFGEVHGGLWWVWVCLSERIRDEVWDEHVVWVELVLRRGGWDGWRRGREMKSLLPDLWFIGRGRIKGHYRRIILNFELCNNGIRGGW